MESFYYHSFRKINMDRLCSVIENGFILPRRMMKNPPTDTNNIFNGNDWISLTQKSLMDDCMRYHARSSYDEVITNSLCVVINPDISGIVYPDYVDWDSFFPGERSSIIKDDNMRRYSYYMDEVQTNTPVSVNDFLAVGYPFTSLRGSNKDVEADIDRIEDALKKHNLDLPILDSSIYSFADDYDSMKLSKIRK